MVHTVPLGDLTRLHVCHDNTGPAPGWYLEKVIEIHCILCGLILVIGI